MPVTKMGAGQQIETLNQAELEAVLGRQTTTWFQEQARGFTTARFGDVETPSGGAVQVPATDDTVFGPDAGFAWAVQRVSADGLATNDTLKVYRDVVTPLNFLGYITSSGNFQPGSKGVILRGGEKLVISGTALAATGDVVVTGEAVQCSELDIYKIL